jgi:hypothetical protein
LATFTFLNTANGTFAGTAGDDLFIWPTVNGSIDAGDTFFGGAGNDTLRLDSAVSLSFTGASAPQWMAGIERIVVNNTGAGNAITIGATAGAPEGGTITMIGGVGNDEFFIATRTAGYNGIFESAGGNDRFWGAAATTCSARAPATIPSRAVAATTRSSSPRAACSAPSRSTARIRLSAASAPTRCASPAMRPRVWSCR